ncbi:hypothetical protein V6N13_077326 [Hibiscus sabdariffa]|uniref:B box-type domain-containing protein n=1 Tax=Hibiscus sabdariffa TaxID=183260 RepID=A0ABR2CP77_9ROSI
MGETCPYKPYQLMFSFLTREAEHSRENKRKKRKKMKSCELCMSAATTYCESDQASLCWHCDTKVHGANFIVARHVRCLLCHACQARTPWRATVSSSVAPSPYAKRASMAVIRKRAKQKMTMMKM